MHVRIRFFGRPDTVVVVESKLTKIETLRLILKDKFSAAPDLQRLFYGGKLLEDGYTFHDYNIKLNDVIQLTLRVQDPEILKGSEKLKNVEKSEDSEKPKISIYCDTDEEVKPEYKDADSVLYAIGDLVDMKHREIGAWFEGEIIAIYHDPDAPSTSDNKNNSTDKTITDTEKANKIFKKNDLENKPPEFLNVENSKTKKGIAKYFTKPQRDKKMSEKELTKATVPIEKTDKNLLYKVKRLIEDNYGSEFYCKLDEIRPRARTVLDPENVKKGDMVMLNYNLDNPSEKGHWYDFKVTEIKRTQKFLEYKGVLQLLNSSTIDDRRVWIHDDVYAIEGPVVPVALRTQQYKEMMTTPTPKRARPPLCLKCRDVEDVLCKECSCSKCGGKESPEKIVLCDECDAGFHISCLSPPLSAVPDEDWYCPSCKRDNKHIVAPGAAQQAKKITKTTRDWGRGMACVGKTKTCAMPANHFGPIPGIEVGMTWRFRIQLSETGIHRPPVSGIHGRDAEGAYSIVLSGGYEDDVDNGYEFTYTGSGGRDLSGNKRTAGQSHDQMLVRENRALARNCAVKTISSEGADAGDNWQKGKPVRVVRSAKMLQHFPKYAPKAGIRYDGIYKVVKYYPEVGLSGYRVWKYLLRRDDPTPAPWEKDAKQFPIIYPDGFLEAEAEKKKKQQEGNASKGAGKAKRASRSADKSNDGAATKTSRKRALQESNHSTDEDDSGPPLKKQANSISKGGRVEASYSSASDTSDSENGEAKITYPQEEIALTKEVQELIEADTMNAKLWQDCLDVCKEKNIKKELVERVTQMFVCIICHEVAVCPATTPCLHNFCMTCLTQALKRGKACPCCRHSLTDYVPDANQPLVAALRYILPGYDAGKTKQKQPSKTKVVE